MRKYILASCVAATLLSTVLLAADIDGKWVLETQGQNGKATQTLTLKADGGKLTGSRDNQGTVVDGKVDISEGTIDGSKVSFTVVRDMNGTQVTRKFSGMMDGSELKLTAEAAGGPGGGRGGAGGQQLVFKRQ